MKVGIGYDVHRFAAGRRLVLGGVEIPHHAGLEGHSDADVLIHAVVDAILGALGEGDIGQHFPDTDRKYKGIDSTYFLDQAKIVLEKKGYAISNIDSTILAMEPKVMPHASRMKEVMGRHLGIDPARINVKATTTEGLGFVGEKKGMAAYAVACLRQK